MVTLLRKIDSSGSISIYSKLGFNNLPFPTDPVVNPYSPDPRLNGTIYTEDSFQEEIRKFERLLIRPDDFLNRARLAYLWSKGDQQSGRGMGKTALLRYFRQRINKDWGATEFNNKHNVVVVYVSFPSQVDRRYMEQLALSALIDICKNGVLDAALANMRYNLLDESMQDKFMNGDIDSVQLLNPKWYPDNDIDLSSITNKIKQQLNQNGINSLLSSYFANGNFEDYLRSLRKDGNLEPLYIPRDTKILDYSRTLLFNDVVKFLMAAGFDGGYLFIDDIENLIDQMTRKDRIEFAKEFALCTIRPGYTNTNEKFFSNVITTHQQASVALSQAWGDAGLAAIARLDPSSHNSVELPLPIRDQAKNIIIAHLDYFRINQSEKGTIKPFTQDGLDELLIKRNLLHPRQLISTLSTIFTSAANEGVDSIDSIFINKILNQENTYSAIDYSEGIEESI